MYERIKATSNSAHSAFNLFQHIYTKFLRSIAQIQKKNKSSKKQNQTLEREVDYQGLDDSVGLVMLVK